MRRRDGRRRRWARAAWLVGAAPLVGVGAWLALAGSGAEDAAPARAAAVEPLRLAVEVLAVHPHDPAAFTQGLLWHQGTLLESTGQYGSSSLRRVDLESGEVRRRVDLDPALFGEGLARVGDRLVQLTWREETALVWGLESFEPLGRRSYRGEGWGLCFDGRHLVRSDGTAVLTRHDPATLETVSRLPVTLRGEPLSGLNELECAEGWIYANVYQTDVLVRVDPDSGEVRALIDAAGLLSAAERGDADVLNGIAYDEERAIFYLTGKLWPKLFAVRFVVRDP